MPKVFLKNPRRTLFLALLIASAPSFAAYSDDPDCKAVSDSAKNAVTQIGKQVDQAAADTGKAIASTKSCIDQLLEQANRSVPNFGGGMIDSLLQLATNLMLQQACSMLGNAQSQATTAINSAIPTIPSIPSIPNVSLNTPASTVSETSTGSIWQRISNLF